VAGEQVILVTGSDACGTYWEMEGGLVSGLRGREPSGFTDFYAAHSRGLLVFFARRTFDVETARDLTAETFALAFEHRRSFRGSTDAEAAAWLYGIARHQLARHARKGKVEQKAVGRLGIRVPTVSAEDYDRVVELAGLAEMRDRIAGVFAGLTNDQRDAVRLRVIDERPYAEVAHSLAVSEQTARARVSRALQALADAVEMTLSPEVTP
jgi:RNA polymerase sigma factor (sigma-70 family)